MVNDDIWLASFSDLAYSDFDTRVLEREAPRAKRLLECGIRMRVLIMGTALGGVIAGATVLTPRWRASNDMF